VFKNYGQGKYFLTVNHFEERSSSEQWIQLRECLEKYVQLLC